MQIISSSGKWLPEVLRAEGDGKQIREGVACLVTLCYASKVHDELILGYERAYVVVGELFDVLPAVAARGRQLVLGQFGYHIDLLDLPAAVLDHLDDCGLLGT